MKQRKMTDLGSLVYKRRLESEKGRIPLRMILSSGRLIESGAISEQLPFP